MNPFYSPIPNPLFPSAFSLFSYDNIDQFLSFQLPILSPSSLPFTFPLLSCHSQPKSQTGRWSQSQHKLYLQVIQSRPKKKQLLKRLLEKIPSRTDSQIRAHHQKMLKKYKSMEGIEKTVVVEVEGMKEVVGKLERVVRVLEMVVKRGGGWEGVDVREIVEKGKQSQEG